MTHDELLAMISLEDKQLISYEEFEKRNLALRAVVELHKPMEKFPDVCGECGFDAVVLYPCPTIQAIEKELS